MTKTKAAKKARAARAAKAAKAAKAIKDFDEYFKEDILENWQRLLVDLGVDGTFTSKTQCRRAVKTKVWVNIYDFLDAVKDGQTPRKFPNERTLAQYTMENDLVFPKISIPKGTPMSALMAHIR